MDDYLDEPRRKINEARVAAGLRPFPAPRLCSCGHPWLHHDEEGCERCDCSGTRHH